jgi:hypothetical protein
MEHDGRQTGEDSPGGRVSRCRGPHRLRVPQTDESAVGVCQPGAASPVVVLRCISDSDTPIGLSSCATFTSFT